MELPVEDIGIAVKLLLPIVVADEYGVGTAEAFLLGNKIAAEHGRNAENLKEARGDEGLSNSFRQRTGKLGEVVFVVAGDAGERRGHAVPVFQTSRRDEGVGVAALGVVLENTDQLVAVRKRQRTQHDGVNGGEHRGVGADAEREREDDGKREARRLEEKTHSGAEMESKRFAERGEMHFPHLLPYLLAAAEVNECAPARFLGTHAASNVGGNHAFNVIGDLAIDGIGFGFVHCDLLIPTLQMALARGIEDELNRFGEPVPGLFFGHKLAAALGGELVEARLAAVVRFAPVGRDPAAFFQAMQRGIERALLHLEDIVGDLANALGDAVAVHRADAARLAG